MVRPVEKSGVSPERVSPAGSRPFLPPALLPNTICAEAALAKANRELRMLIDCKRSLARAQDESQLLAEICRTLVGPGGYRLAWVGLAGAQPDCAVRVAAHAGHHSGYIEGLRVSWNDDARGRGPAGRAIRERKVQACRHIDTDPDFSPWREQAHREGYRSCIGLPLLLDGECIGALTIYADHPDAFDDGEARPTRGARRRSGFRVEGAADPGGETHASSSRSSGWRRSCACRARSIPPSSASASGTSCWARPAAWQRTSADSLMPSHGSWWAADAGRGSNAVPDPPYSTARPCSASSSATAPSRTPASQVARCARARSQCARTLRNPDEPIAARERTARPRRPLADRFAADRR